MTSLVSRLAPSKAPMVWLLHFWDAIPGFLRFGERATYLPWHHSTKWVRSLGGTWILRREFVLTPKSPLPRALVLPLLHKFAVLSCLSLSIITWSGGEIIWCRYIQWCVHFLPQCHRRAIKALVWQEDYASSSCVFGHHKVLT